MECLTSSEKVSLSKLRDRIGDLHLPHDELEDKNLIRWLRARKQDVKAAEEMIRKNALWKEEYNVKDLRDFEVNSEWVEGFPYFLTGFDKFGCPVMVTRLGEWDVHVVMSQGNKSEFQRFAVQMIEKVWTLCKRQSQGRTYMAQFISIYDFKGLSLRQVTSYDVIETCLTVARIFEANYPENLKRGFILNAPWAFQLLWKVIRPLIDERTHSKLVFLGSDMNIWRDEIGKVVPLDQLPQYLGGTQPENLKMRIEKDGSYKTIDQHA